MAIIKDIDFSAIGKTALNSSEVVLEHFLPGGRFEGNEYVVRNPRRKDSSLGSFKINTRTGKWGDFAIGEEGGDLISLVAYINNCNQPEAAKLLAEFLGVPIPAGNIGNVGNRTSKHRSGDQSTSADPVTPALRKTKLKVTGIPIVPIPEDAPPPPEAHFKLGAPAAIWTYKDADDQPVLHIYRFNLIGEEKEFRPLTYCRMPDGTSKWQWTSLPEPRLLYHLAELKTRLDMPVIICEGEKSADAAQELFPDCITTTWPHGAKAVALADWSILKGRECWLWPDWDNAGREAMEKVMKQLRKIGAANVKEINVLKLAGSPQEPSNEPPEKFDAADAVANGWTADHVIALLHSPNFFLSNTVTAENKIAVTSVQYPPDFYTNEHGVYFRTGDDNNPTIWICSPLEITAAVSDGKNQSWGRRLEFSDMRGNHHSWCMPMEMLKSSGEEYRGHLLNMGLNIAPGTKARNQLSYFIQMTKPGKFARCVTMTGWHNNVFVLPERTIGTTAGEDIFFQSDSLFRHGLNTMGTLEEWRQTLGAWSKGNSRLILALCTGFGAPLLHLVGEEGGGINLKGPSSIGKTTALSVAGSLYGGKEYVKTWRATDNGLEGTAKGSNHLLLLLDEMGQVDPQKAGEIAYMLTNGSTKQRANRSGGARSQEYWQLLFLSSGEISLADHMRTVGKRATAGQEIRIVDVLADAGVGHGLFENLHGYSDGDSFARALKHAASQFHGIASIQFIEHLTENLDTLPSMIKAFRDDFVTTFVTKPASGQVIRVAGRFALLAAAGEIATSFGITGWTPSEATEAIGKCFMSWLELRGGTGAQEPAAILAQVRLFFEQHGESRFTPWDGREHDRDTINRAGFRKEVQVGVDNETEFYVLPEIFKSEICKGFDQKTVSRLLVEEGLIITGTDGKPASIHRLPNIGTKRCYRFSSKVLAE